ncbi:hypothetical protein [Rhizobium leguminosarum]|uniref:hypothetical protein n=1 Tax=Rhizobium leguminosarum TaxID=384 RepID=UPI001C968F90|nr:hypothetical protein [Rhizobium leguminosarum]MBY5821439.1 hypothetical protein [Rhizobium leguminosarum]
MREFTVGQEFKNAYPFIRGKYSFFDEEGENEVDTWTPGVRYEACGPYGEDSKTIVDGKGWQILTVIDVHKPGRYPERVFYTVKWINPDGKEFGKGKLHIATTEKFRRWSRGYKFANEIYLSEDAA